uniref:Uncharacterized protein n=1 Tax=Meloidogyne incognita TaxID=6306 RepID=A0A914NDT9_MELIC
MRALTSSATYRRAITSFRIVESGPPWHISMRLDELNRTIPGVPDSTIINEVYNSARYTRQLLWTVVELWCGCAIVVEVVVSCENFKLKRRRRKSRQKL